MEGKDRLQLRRSRTEPNLSDGKHLAALLLYECIRTQAERVGSDVPCRTNHRCHMGPDSGNIHRQGQSPLGKIPFMADLRRHPSGCLCHPMLLERFQRLPSLCLHHICRHEHVLHPDKCSIRSPEFVPYP